MAPIWRTFVHWKKLHLYIDGSFNNPTTKKDEFLVILSELEDMNDSIQELYSSNIMSERRELIRLRWFLPKKSGFLINPVVGKTTNLLCKWKGVFEGIHEKNAFYPTV